MSTTVTTSTEPVKNENGTYQLTINNYSLSAVEVFVPTTFRYFTAADETRFDTVTKDATFMGDGTYASMKKENFCELFDLIFRAFASYVIYKTEDSKRFFVYYDAQYITPIQLGLITMLHSNKIYEPIYDAVVAKEKKGEVADVEKDILAVILLKTECTSVKIDSALLADESIKRFGTFFNDKETITCDKKEVEEKKKKSSSMIFVAVGIIIIAVIVYLYLKNKKEDSNTKKTTGENVNV